MFWNYLLVSVIIKSIVCDERIITTLKHTVLRVKPTIVQGQPVEPGRIPFIVSIKSIHRKYDNETILWRNLCGGSIIHIKRVLTAAHCFEDNDFFLVKNPQMIRIVAGSLANEVTEMKNGNNISDPAVQWRGIKRIFVHNEFNFPINDIALLIVDNPWKFDHSVHSVQVAKEGEDNWANCIVAGYGRVSHDSKAPSSPTLLLAYINILSKNNCSTLWEINMDKFVCSDSVVSSDVAKGDSGGPLVCDGQSKASLFPENERLVGVICGKNFDKTTLFTRVSGYSEFITRLRGKDDGDDYAFRSHGNRIVIEIICFYTSFIIHFIATIL